MDLVVYAPFVLRVVVTALGVVVYLGHMARCR